jgi:AraC-like DNA-binding protein
MARSSKGIPLVTAPKALGRHDVVLLGKALSCEGVDYVATNTRFTADPLGWHCHRGYELLFMLRGCSGYEFQDGRKLKLSGGQFLVVPPRLEHRGIEDLREPTRVCAIVLRPHLAGLVGGVLTGREWGEVERRLSANRLRVGVMAAAMKQAARGLHEGLVEQVRTPERSGLGLAELRMQAGSLILQAVARAVEFAGAGAEVIAERVRVFLEEHFAAPFSVERTCEAAGCSRTRLFEAFKRETGMTPVDWLRRLRVERAVGLLESTERTLEDIAASVGLTSAAYLCHVVKRYTGRTPGEYRGSGLGAVGEKGGQSTGMGSETAARGGR